ncbi:DNA polymerase III subunit epsilon [Hirschia litorea]|uniref:DNA polymerase III subunit epsilon n=1 Tax=Hirschia litorea TaxID=1199156 RepID=A0ABW2IN82_9PROT
MREICFDTETTGLNAKEGDRIIELGAVEIVNLLPTGREFHRLIYPERAVSADTVRITGITDKMLAGKPVFSDPSVHQEFLDFIGDAPLVAHNAEFDRGFINEEFRRIGLPELSKDRFVDTLAIAKNKYPGASATLDALCKRFDISLASRDVHTAVVDSQLLAAVYLELQGGREHSFVFEDEVDEETKKQVKRIPLPQRPNKLPSLITAEENEAHLKFVDTLGDAPKWKQYFS